MKTQYFLVALTGGYLAFSSSLPGWAHDGDVIFTSADICAPVNVGKANRNIQNIRGTTANLSTSESIAVSCPLTNIPFNSLMNVAVVAQNSAAVAQEFRCVLREKDPENLDVQAMSLTIEIGPSASDVLAFEDVAVIDPAASRFNLTCLLPPESGLGLLSTASFFE